MSVVNKQLYNLLFEVEKNSVISWKRVGGKDQEHFDFNIFTNIDYKPYDITYM